MAQTTLSSERSSIAGGAGGATPQGLIDLARRRGRSGDPRLRQAIVDVHVRSELLRFLRYRSQTALSQGRRPGSEASVMKLAYGRYMKALTETAIATQGAWGMLGSAHDHRAGTDPRSGDQVGGHGVDGDDGMWLRRFLHTPSLRIGGGTDEVQATIISDRVLGLPPEPRTDKHVPYRDLASQRQ